MFWINTNVKGVLRSALLACAVLVTLSANAQLLPTAGQALPGLEAFDEAMLALLNKYGYPGGNLAVAYRGKLVLDKGYGFSKKSFFENTPMAAGQRMRIGSLSKWITAAAALKAQDLGKLNLDQPLVQVLGFSEKASDYNDPRVMAVTVRQLLQNHASWVIDRDTDPIFQRSPPCPSRAQRWLGAQMLKADPGQLFSYTNVNFCLAQLAIEKSTGQKYADFVQAQLAQPARITSWEFATLPGKPDEPTYTPNRIDGPQPYVSLDFEAIGGAGAWTSSAADFLRFMVAQRGQLANASEPLLAAASFLQLTARPKSDATSTAVVHYGLGVEVRNHSNGRVSLFHSGNLPGLSTYAVTYAGGWSIVVMFNGDLPERSMRSAFNSDAALRLREVVEKSDAPVGEIRPL